MKTVSSHMLFFFILCTFALGVGLGISPTSIELNPGETKTVWLNNPNQHTIPVFIETGCNDVEIRNNVLDVDANSLVGVEIIAASKTKGCNATLIISIAKKNSAGLLPSIQIPLIVLPGTKIQDTYGVIPDSAPHFSRAVIILSAMFCLTLVYCANIYRKRLSRKKVN